MFKPASKVFSVEVEGVGRFEFKFPTILDEITVERETFAISGSDGSISPGAKSIAARIAWLKACTLEAPAGWDLEELYDLESLVKVYDAFSDKVFQFRGGPSARDKSAGLPGS